MVNDQLIAYIRLQLNANVSKADIAKTLVAQGWSEADFIEALKMAEVKPAAAPIVSQAQPAIAAQPIAQVADKSVSTAVQKNHSGMLWAVLTSMLAMMLVATVAGGYYVWNLQNQKINALNQALANSTQQATELQAKVGQGSCKGTWSNNACIPYMLSITAGTSTGSVANKITFVVRVPDLNYSIDFGDGSLMWLSDAIGTTVCTPDETGLCSISATHTYKSVKGQSQYTAKLIQGGIMQASVSVTVNG